MIIVEGKIEVFQDGETGYGDTMNSNNKKYKYYKYLYQGPA